MAFLNKSQFSKHAGVSRQRISKMCSLGHLLVRPDGKLDTEDRTNKNYLTKQERPDGYKSSDIDKKQPVRKKAANKTVKSNAENNREIPIENPEEVLAGIPDDLKNMTKHDLDRMKAAVTIIKDRLKHDKEREFVIDRTLIQRAFHDLYQIDTEEFLQASSFIAPRICQNVFGTNDPIVLTKVSEILDTDFYKIQNHIRRTFDKHLADMNLDPVAEVG